MRFDAHQDYITDVGIRGFGRHAGRGLRAAGGARVDGRRAPAGWHGRVRRSALRDDRFMRRKQVGRTRTNHSLARSGFTNSRKSGSPQRDNTA